MGLNEWSDVSVQSIRAVDFVLDPSHFEEQIVRTIEQSRTITQTIPQKIDRERLLGEAENN